MSDLASSRDPLADAGTSQQRFAAPGGRAISVVVNLFGVVLIAGLAYYLGNALYEGVTAQAVVLVGMAAVLVTLTLMPDVGLLLWMTLAPFGRLFNLSMGRGLPDLSLSRMAAGVLLFLLLAQVAAGKRRLARITAIEGWGLAFLAAMALSIGASRLGWVGGIQNVFDLVATPLLCYFFARNVFRRPAQLGRLAVALAIIAAVLGIIAAREQLTNQAILSPLPYRWEYGRHSVKVTSLFGAPAIMALTLALPLPFILVGALRSRELAPRLLWFMAAAATGAGLLLTYVRAGWLAAAVGLLVVAFVIRRGRSTGLLLLLLLLVLVLIFGAGLVDVRAIQERLQAEQPIAYRIGAISVGLKIAARSPLLGLGLDNFSDSGIAAGWRPVGAAGIPVLAPHNLFIYVLTSGGLVALLPLLGLFAAIGLQLVRGLRVTRRGCETGQRDWVVAALAMFICYMLMANTFDALGAQFANMLLFLVLGATFAVVEHTNAPSVAAITEPHAALGHVPEMAGETRT